MKHWKKGLCGLLAAVLMVPAGLAAPVSGGKNLSDLEGHWAQKEVEAAVASGWVDGYPDGSFKPEKSITRAEFTKMLLDAIHLTPDSETVAWMKAHAKMKDIWGRPTAYTPKLYDMSGHWLTSQGWLDAALYSGMVVPDDYNGKNFRPEKAIARYEIALMTDRALGLVYPASQPVEGELPFTDKEEILDWMKGYVNESVKAGVLKGYPDGSFQPNKTSTRAEAVVMIQRMLEKMEEGLNPDITVVARYEEDYEENGENRKIVQEEETDQIQLQVVDNVIYASLNDMYDVEMGLIKRYGKESVDKLSFAWWPIQQEVIAYVTNINTWVDYSYQMGNKEYCWRSNGILKTEYCAPTRALYGELMVPVCDLSHYSREAQDEWKGGWDPETGTLTLLMYYYVPPVRTS
ncbi:MAG: S-layer homology domain-containing protein [Firmicutes bacterium]|nr:S-layer homology domain-containing protein [Bacillota bacterium]